MFKQILLVAVVLFAFVACKDDKKEEECIAPALSQNVVGSWKANVTVGPNSMGPYDITFTNDGKLTGGLKDVVQVLFPVTLDDDISYAVINDETVVVSVFSGGTPLADIPLEMTENTCKKIVLTYTTYTFTLTK